MEYAEFKELFSNSLHQNGFQALGESILERFYRFVIYLMEVNSVTNLTAIRNIVDAIPKHLIDSMLAAEFLPKGSKVLDLGCGPGFPSIPLAIFRPDLEIVALDSTAKKITFVKDASRLLGLTNLSAVVGRAEDRALMAELGVFDVVISRAVAKMSILSELCLPYVRNDGFLLALKAAKAEAELFEARSGIKTLGGGEAELHNRLLTMLDGGMEPRCLIKVPKIKKTPPAYPRAFAAILKKPL